MDKQEVCSQMYDILKKFPVITEFPIAWGEMDSQLHVNNVVYFRYFENARIAYYDKVLLLEMMENKGIGTVLASTYCRYRSALSYPDTVSVGARVSKVEKDRFTMEYCIVSHKTKLVAAEGEGDLVVFDFTKNCKAILPDDLRERIRSVEAECGERGGIKSPNNG